MFDLDFEPEPIRKSGTPCCTMAVFSIKNYHSIEEIKESIEYQKREAFSRKWAGTGPERGQRNILVVISPGEEGENNLEGKLQQLNFKLLSDTMTRRVGYPRGFLKLYLLTF